MNTELEVSRAQPIWSWKGAFYGAVFSACGALLLFIWFATGARQLVIQPLSDPTSAPNGGEKPPREVPVSRSESIEVEIFMMWVNDKDVAGAITFLKSIEPAERQLHAAVEGLSSWLNTTSSHLVLGATDTNTYVGQTQFTSAQVPPPAPPPAQAIDDRDKPIVVEYLQGLRSKLDQLLASTAPDAKSRRNDHRLISTWSSCGRDTVALARLCRNAKVDGSREFLELSGKFLNASHKMSEISDSTIASRESAPSMYWELLAKALTSTAVGSVLLGLAKPTLDVWAKRLSAKIGGDVEPSPTPADPTIRVVLDRVGRRGDTGLTEKACQT